MRLYSVVFYSDDIEPLKKFYVDFLGTEIEREQNNRFISFIFENSVRRGKSFSILDSDGNKIEFLEKQN